MKKVLLVAHHFPPDVAVGAVRPAKFAKFLPEFGWEPVVLTIRESYYGAVDGSQPSDQPYPVFKAGFVRNPSHYYRAFKRALAPLRAAESFRMSPRRRDGTSSKRGAGDLLNACLAFPDEHTGWIPAALWHGLRVVRRHGIARILTSGPPHSTHLIGAWLSRLTGVPWAADFRDPLFLSNKPAFLADRSSPLLMTLDRKLEEYILARASFVMTTTRRLTDELAERHPDWAAKVVTVPNGYDPDDFATVKSRPGAGFTISYLGTLYGSRNPEPVLRAVASLIAKGSVDRADVSIKLVGDCEHTAAGPTRSIVERHGLVGNVQLVPWLPRPDAMEVMAGSHLLLLLAEKQELMIPAKVYDYLGISRPILALTEEGATSDLLRETGRAAVHDPSDDEGIARSIERFYEGRLGDVGCLENAACDGLTRYSRKRLTAQLAGLLDERF
jgi:glycosyltransferase involved in cell wall biosynthesis